MGGAPLPGYLNNWAGMAGMAAATALGMYDRLPVLAAKPTNVIDWVPVDVVAHIVMAAAAAVSAGASAAVLVGSAAASARAPDEGWGLAPLRQQVSKRTGMCTYGLAWHDDGAMCAEGGGCSSQCCVRVLPACRTKTLRGPHPPRQCPPAPAASPLC